MWDRHAIQLQHLRFLKISAELNPNGKGAVGEEFNLTLRCGHSKLNEDKTIGVKVKAFVGFNEDETKNDSSSLWLEVVVEGIFLVDTDKFPVDKVEVWAQQNAPLILYPYVREVGYGLSSRILDGSAAIFPMLTVPTIRVSNETAP